MSMNSPQHTSDKILRYLKDFKTASVSELSLYLGSTKPNIRYHLQDLIETGLVCEIPQKDEIRSRGRPVHKYRLKESVDPENFMNLSAALLTYIFNGPEPKEIAFSKIAQYWIHQPEILHPPGQMLNYAIQRLNMMGYQARWEASVDGPRIICGSCPFARLVQKIPELCLLDQQIIGKFINHSVQRVIKETPPDELPVCIFIYA